MCSSWHQQSDRGLQVGGLSAAHMCCYTPTGIGLEFVKQLLARNNKVIAACRFVGGLSAHVCLLHTFTPSQHSSLLLRPLAALGQAARASQGAAGPGRGSDRAGRQQARQRAGRLGGGGSYSLSTPAPAPLLALPPPSAHPPTLNTTLLRRPGRSAWGS